MALGSRRGVPGHKLPRRRAVVRPGFAKDSALSYDNRPGDTAYEGACAAGASGRPSFLSRPAVPEPFKPTMSRNNLSNTTTTTIAVAADYADAMMTARKAKNVLFLVLLLVLLTQLSLFFLLRFGVLRLGDELAVEQTSESAEATPASAGASAQPEAGATQPAAAAADASEEADAGTVRASSRVEEILRYVIPVTDFLGMTMVVVLAVVLLLIVTIMLIGRLIGVSHVTSAFVWCVVLAVLLFPWQAFLLDHYRPAAPAAEGEEQLYVRPAADPAFKIPGALYTWEELRRDYDFRGNLALSVLKWFRFAVAPIISLLLLMMVQAKSSRGLKFALGESEVQVEVSSPRL